MVAISAPAGLSRWSHIGLRNHGQHRAAIFLSDVGHRFARDAQGLFSGELLRWRVIAQRALLFPPLIALMLSLVLGQVVFPPWLIALLHRLGDLVAPLALVSVGLQLRIATTAANRTALACGLAFKLVGAPLVMAVLYAGALHRTGDTMRVTVFEAAMGPQVASGIVAIQYGLNARLVTLMVGLGITLSFVTLPFWWLGLARL